VGQYRDGDKLIDIVLRQPLDERNALTDLANAYVPTTTGRSIPLTPDRQGQLHLGAGRAVAREPRLRGHGAGRHHRGPAGRHRDQPAEPAVQADARKMPPGYRIEVAGAVEESSKGRARSPPARRSMLFIMFTLLMLQLHSFSRSMLVFLTGAAGHRRRGRALLLLNRPFGFVALLGVIALMGMIMRNSVILIDQIEQDRAKRACRPGRDRRGGGAALPADHPDRGRGGAGDDPAVAQRVLGADGGGHHGRADRRDGADAAGLAGDVCGLVPRQTGRSASRRVASS
jgi:multidrug efflux pump